MLMTADDWRRLGEIVAASVDGSGCLRVDVFVQLVTNQAERAPCSDCGIIGPHSMAACQRIARGRQASVDLWAAPADIVKAGAEPKTWIVLSTSFPTANPPFHRDCHCVLDDGRVSVGGACVSGDCDCRAVDGLQAGSQEALAWAAAQRKGG